MPPARGCCSRAPRLGLRVTQLDPRRGSSIHNNRAPTPLLTCAANEQQPPEQLPYLQHNVSDLLLDDASPAVRRGGGGQTGAFLRDNNSLLPDGFLVLVATRVHGTMTDRQQPKHAHARTSEEQHELLRPVDYAHTRARAHTRGGLKWNKVVRAVAA